VKKPPWYEQCSKKHMISSNRGACCTHLFDKNIAQAFGLQTPRWFKATQKQLGSCIIPHAKRVGWPPSIQKDQPCSGLNLYDTKTFTLYKPMDPEICKSLNLAHLLPKYSTSNLKHDRLWFPIVSEFSIWIWDVVRSYLLGRCNSNLACEYSHDQTLLRVRGNRCFFEITWSTPNNLKREIHPKQLVGYYCSCFTEVVELGCHWSRACETGSTEDIMFPDCHSILNKTLLICPDDTNQPFHS